jgi:hypothetical protein
MTDEVEKDIRRDTKGTEGCLALLFLLGIIGLVLASRLGAGAQEGVGVLVGACLLLIIISVVLSLVRRNPAAQGMERVVGPYGGRTGPSAGKTILSGCVTVIIVAIVVAFATSAGMAIFILLACEAAFGRR